MKEVTKYGRKIDLAGSNSEDANNKKYNVQDKCRATREALK
jgi:hypothetical protein